MGNGPKVVTGPLPALPLSLTCSLPHAHPTPTPTPDIHPTPLGSMAGTFCIRSLLGSLSRVKAQPGSAALMLFLRERAQPQTEGSSHFLPGHVGPSLEPALRASVPGPISFGQKLLATLCQEDPPSPEELH